MLLRAAAAARAASRSQRSPSRAPALMACAPGGQLAHAACRAAGPAAAAAGGGDCGGGDPPGASQASPARGPHQQRQEHEKPQQQRRPAAGPPAAEGARLARRIRVLERQVSALRQGAHGRPPSGRAPPPPRGEPRADARPGGGGGGGALSDGVPAGDSGSPLGVAVAEGAEATLKSVHPAVTQFLSSGYLESQAQ